MERASPSPHPRASTAPPGSVVGPTFVSPAPPGPALAGRPQLDRAEVTRLVERVGRLHLIALVLWVAVTVAGAFAADSTLETPAAALWVATTVGLSVWAIVVGRHATRTLKGASTTDGSGRVVEAMSVQRLHTRARVVGTVAFVFTYFAVAQLLILGLGLGDDEEGGTTGLIVFALGAAVLLAVVAYRATRHAVLTRA